MYRYNTNKRGKLLKYTMIYFASTELAGILEEYEY